MNYIHIHIWDTCPLGLPELLTVAQIPPLPTTPGRDTFKPDESCLAELTLGDVQLEPTHQRVEVEELQGNAPKIVGGAHAVAARRRLTSGIRKFPGSAHYSATAPGQDAFVAGK